MRYRLQTVSFASHISHYLLLDRIGEDKLFCMHFCKHLWRFVDVRASRSSQRFRWRFKSSWMLRLVDSWIFPDVQEELSAFIFSECLTLKVVAQHLRLNFRFLKTFYAAYSIILCFSWINTYILKVLSLHTGTASCYWQSKKLFKMHILSFR